MKQETYWSCPHLHLVVVPLDSQTQIPHVQGTWTKQHQTPAFSDPSTFLSATNQMNAPEEMFSKYEQRTIK